MTKKKLFKLRILDSSRKIGCCSIQKINVIFRLVQRIHTTEWLIMKSWYSYINNRMIIILSVGNNRHNSVQNSKGILRWGNGTVVSKYWYLILILKNNVLFTAFSLKGNIYVSGVGGAKTSASNFQKVLFFGVWVRTANEINYGKWIE